MGALDRRRARWLVDIGALAIPGVRKPSSLAGPIMAALAGAAVGAAAVVSRALVGLGPVEAATLPVQMLLNHKDLTIQDADAVAAALAHYRRRPRLGFSDCLVLEVARKAGHLPLGTFDRELGKLEGAQKL